uniref:ETFB lysine methyltransferase n=1 Tax=Chromera velia CCMP2878 TaxID=1169474 RepID=A0A0G4GG80_9ALVE|eukprot:Cvel_4664.t1-p1 / transcript=Cvel_4664.t1 / gene=Cvel_4664 / organism=Chromera_velia_CCMP2878 / gene_product=Ribosomal protein L11 methyltransferase, putative / transcript_product=Ribosomal protein L11 methyltransferase, putative / location=Cvel_scaffold206:17014-21375(+) / protein_length=502 / sequence_SO=supercontig / SO=protein_coding / is_pseudo=false
MQLLSPSLIFLASFCLAHVASFQLGPPCAQRKRAKPTKLFGASEYIRMSQGIGKTRRRERRDTPLDPSFLALGGDGDEIVEEAEMPEGEEVVEKVENPQEAEVTEELEIPEGFRKDIFQFRIQVADSVERPVSRLQAGLLELGAHGVEIKDAYADTDRETPIYDVDDFDPLPERTFWKLCNVTAIFSTETDVAEIVGAVLQLLEVSDIEGFEKLNPQISLVEDRDWFRESAEQWGPLKVGGFVFEYEGGTPLAEGEGDGRILIKMEGGRGFGTGQHETTQLCLQWLEKVKEDMGEEKLGRARFLDYGSGSGILSLAASKLGLGHVVGVEIDGSSNQAAMRHFRLNGLLGDDDTKADGQRDGREESERKKKKEWKERHANLLRPDTTEVGDIDLPFLVLSEQGKEEEKEKEPILSLPVETRTSAFELGQFDVVCANIHPAKLIPLAPLLGHLCSPGARLAISGVLDEQVERTSAAFRPFFSDLDINGKNEGWVLLSGTRNSDS